MRGSVRDSLVAAIVLGVFPSAGMGQAGQTTVELLNHAIELQQLGTPEALRLAETEYRRLLSDRGLRPEDQQQVYNNLGVVYFTLKEFSKAIEMYRQVEPKAMQRLSTPVFEFNFGRSLEESGEFAEAFDHFRRAVELKPDFEDALEVAYRVLRQLPAPESGAVSGLCRPALDGGLPMLAKDCLHQALHQHVGQGEARILLNLLAQSYADASLTPAQFKASESPELDQLKRRFAGLGPAIDQLERAFADQSLSVSSGPDENARVFSEWSGDQGKVFARLLTAIAWHYQTDKDLVPALMRYQFSWLIHAGDGAAIVAAAQILSEDAGKLPADNSYLETLVKLVSAREPNGSADTRLILDLHQLLGHALAARACQSKDDPMDPLYHWTRARQAYLELGDKAPASPVLFQALGNCAAAEKGVQDSANAAKGFAEYGIDAEAGKYYSAARLALLKTEDRKQLNCHELVRADPLSPSFFRGCSGSPLVETLDQAGELIKLSVRLKLEFHGGRFTSWEEFARSAGSAAIGQVRDSPHQWGQDTAGFGRRFASSLSGNFVRQTLAFGLDVVSSEDPRYVRSGRDRKNYGMRLADALKQTLWTQTDTHHWRPSVSRLGSAYGYGFIAGLWRPDGINSVGDALVRGSTALVRETVYNLMHEFWPDIKGRLKRKDPSPPQASGQMGASDRK